MNGSIIKLSEPQNFIFRNDLSFTEHLVCTDSEELSVVDVSEVIERLLAAGNLDELIVVFDEPSQPTSSELRKGF